MQLDTRAKQFYRFLVCCLGMLTAQVHGQQSAILIANSGPGSVTRYNEGSGAYEGIFVAPGSGGLGSGCLTAPTSLVIGPDGHLYVASGGAVDVVLRYDGQTGASMGAFVSYPTGGLNEPSGMIFGPGGDLYVSSKETDEVLRYDGSTGAPIGAFVSAGSGGLDEPFGLTFGPDGNLYVCSVLTETIIRYNGATGAFIDVFATDTVIDVYENIALVFGPDGNLYVTSAHPGKVVRFNGTTGAAIDEFVVPGAGGLEDPISLRFGADGDLYVLDYAEDNVLRFDGTTGDFIDTFVAGGSGGLECPYDFIFTTLPPPASVPPNLPDSEKHQTRKNRYVSISPATNGLVPVAYALELASMKRCTGDLARTCGVDDDCPSLCDNDNTIQCVDDGVCGGGTCAPTSPCVEHPHVGTTVGWVGEPLQVSDGCDPLPCGDEDWIARVEPNPVYRVWTQNLIHVGDCEIAPAATYMIRATLDGVVFSDPLAIGTIRKPDVRHYGDVAGGVDAGTGQYTEADGFVNVVDVQAYLHTLQNYPNGSPFIHRTWVDLHGLDSGTAPNYIVNVSDLQRIKFGFEGRTYTQTPEQLDPGDCP